MVGASQVIRETGIPRTTFYRLIEEKRIPVHDVERKPWQKRAVKRFLLSEVRDALERLADDSPADSAPS